MLILHPVDECLYFLGKISFIINHTYRVPCPNCGSLATRIYFTSQESRYGNCPKNQVIQTECPACDYLMVMCSLSGNVIEAYASSSSMMSKEHKNPSILLPAKLSA